jgi:hypothetical protein
MLESGQIIPDIENSPILATNTWRFIGAGLGAAFRAFQVGDRSHDASLALWRLHPLSGREYSLPVLCLLRCVIEIREPLPVKDFARQHNRAAYFPGSNR